MLASRIKVYLLDLVRSFHLLSKFLLDRSFMLASRINFDVRSFHAC